MGNDNLGTVLQVLIKILLVVLVTLVFACLSTVIHEYSHALAAIILGVSPFDIHVELFAIPPHINVPVNSFSEMYLPYYHLAGGVVAGIILLVIYILILIFWSKRFDFNLFHLSSLVGFAALLIAIVEIYQGFWEGLAFKAYLQVEHFQLPFVALPIVTAILVHFLVTPIRKHLRKYS